MHQSLHQPRCGLVCQPRSCVRLRRETLRSAPSGFRSFSSWASGRTNCLISEALADDAFEQHIGAVGIVVAKGNAVAVAEVEFVDVALQMLARAMLIDAAHSALEDAEIAFDGVGVNLTTPIFFDAVLDGFMPIKEPANRLLRSSFVGVQLGQAADVC